MFVEYREVLNKMGSMVSKLDLRESPNTIRLTRPVHQLHLLVDQGSLQKTRVKKAKGGKVVELKSESLKLIDAEFDLRIDGLKKSKGKELEWVARMELWFEFVPSWFQTELFFERVKSPRVATKMIEERLAKVRILLDEEIITSEVFSGISAAASECLQKVQTYSAVNIKPRTLA